MYTIISVDTSIDCSKNNHAGDADKSPCEIEVKRAIEKMKIYVANESTVEPSDIYKRQITSVIKKGYLISDTHKILFPNIKHFVGLNKIKEKQRLTLPKNMRYINFKLLLYRP